MPRYFIYFKHNSEKWILFAITNEESKALRINNRLASVHREEWRTSASDKESYAYQIRKVTV
jgi:hypothetical protein